MGVTNYYWTGDMLLGESGPNGKVDYLTDALGSVTTTVNGTGAVLNEYRYKPYGAQLSKTGTAPDPKFTWVGSQGYRQTGLAHSDVYVRARHFSNEEGIWTTKDGIWPREHPYNYVNGRSTTSADPTGFAMPACCLCVTSLSLSSPSRFQYTDPNTPPPFYRCADYTSNSVPLGAFGWTYTANISMQATKPPSGQHGGLPTWEFIETLTLPTGSIVNNSTNIAWWETTLNYCYMSNPVSSPAAKPAYGCYITSTGPCMYSESCVLPDRPYATCQAAGWYYYLTVSWSVTNPACCNGPAKSVLNCGTR